MNIRPVDSQVNLNRAAEVNRVTNNDGSRAENQNAQFANSFQKAARNAEVEVASTNETENAKLRNDKKDRDGRKKRNKNGSKNAKNNEDEKSLLDIKI